MFPVHLLLGNTQIPLFLMFRTKPLLLKYMYEGRFAIVVKPNINWKPCVLSNLLRHHRPPTHIQLTNREGQPGCPWAPLISKGSPINVGGLQRTQDDQWFIVALLDRTTHPCCPGLISLLTGAGRAKVTTLSFVQLILYKGKVRTWQCTLTAKKKKKKKYSNSQKKKKKILYKGLKLALFISNYLNMLSSSL